MIIDIISDIVCPWCYIGWRNLVQAMEQESVPFEVRFRPYQLDPNVPREGVDRAAYMRQRFPDAAQRQAMSEALTEAGKKAGIAFALDRIQRSPNTLDLHRLILWAGGANRGPALAERLFVAYFIEGTDLTRREILVGLAADAGLDGVLIAQLLEGDEDVSLVQDQIDHARRIGVTGVPTFIFDQRLAVVGAQPPEVLLSAIRQAAAAA